MLYICMYPTFFVCLWENLRLVFITVTLLLTRKKLPARMSWIAVGCHYLLDITSNSWCHYLIRLWGFLNYIFTFLPFKCFSFFSFWEFKKRTILKLTMYLLCILSFIFHRLKIWFNAWAVICGANSQFNKICFIHCNMRNHSISSTVLILDKLYVAFHWAAQSLGLPFLSPYLQSIGSDYRHGANYATLASTVLLPNTSLFVTGISPFSLAIQLNQMKQFKTKVNEVHEQGTKCTNFLVLTLSFNSKAL